MPCFGHPFTHNQCFMGLNPQIYYYLHAIPFNHECIGKTLTLITWSPNYVISWWKIHIIAVCSLKLMETADAVLGKLIFSANKKNRVPLCRQRSYVLMDYLGGWC